LTNNNNKGCWRIFGHGRVFKTDSQTYELYIKDKGNDNVDLYSA